MSVLPEDDYTHPVGAESNFNESYYFNFYDREKGIGGFMRLGNRVNEGHAEMTLCIYLPNGHALFDFQRASIANNDRFEAGGMSFDMVEPLKRHRADYKGNPIDMANPLDLVEPGKAFKSNPRVEFEVALEYEATGEIFEPPPYDLRHAFSLQLPSTDKRSMGELLQVIQEHNEQHMKAKGHVLLAGERIEIDALGFRDHSWGPRTWSAGGGHSRWLTVALREDLGLMVQDLGRPDGTRLLTGVVVRNGKLDWMRELELSSEWAPGPWHKSVRVRFTTEGGEQGVLEGTVKALVPLRHKGAGSITRVGEGLTEYRLGDVVGWGLSEYFDHYPEEKAS
jgi:hypothetical protein